MKGIDRLNDLIQLDLDAIRAYEHAIRACEHESVASKLREFQSDHKRHVSELSVEVQALGGKPPHRPDVKGFLIEGFTAATSLGTHSALMSMQGNEKLTTSKYESALKAGDVPASALDIVRRNFADEQRHLTWIQQALQQRVWEHEASSHA